MEKKNEEDYLDSLLDSVSVIKDDNIEQELFDEDTNDLIGKLNNIMQDVGIENDDDKSKKQSDINKDVNKDTVNIDSSIIDNNIDSSKTSVQEDMPSIQPEGEAVQNSQKAGASQEDVQEDKLLNVDDEMKELLGEHLDSNIPEGASQGTELSQAELDRLNKMDAESQDVQAADGEGTNESAGNKTSKKASTDKDDLIEPGIDDSSDELDKFMSSLDKSEKKGLAGFFAGLFKGKDKKDNDKVKDKKSKKAKKSSSKKPDKNTSANTSAEAANDDSSVQQQENDKVLQELFDENGNLINDDERKPSIKKESFFSRLFGKKNNKAALDSSDEATAAQDSDMSDIDMDMMEDEALKAEKEAAAAKKEQKKKEKEEKAKEKKAKKESKKKEKEAKKKAKPKKEKKPKPAKPAPRPEEMMKVTPAGVITVIVITVAVCSFIYLGITMSSYNNNVEEATTYLTEHNYSKAFDCIEGIKAKNDADDALFRQITTIMYVEKQRMSYENYKKLGLEYEALDSLIKGIGKYYAFKAQGEELGVIQDMEQCKNNIASILEQNYGISESLAETYYEIEDVVQYYYIINSYVAQE